MVAGRRRSGGRGMGGVRVGVEWPWEAKKGRMGRGESTVMLYGRRARRRGDLASRSGGYDLAIAERIGHGHRSMWRWRVSVAYFAHSTFSHVAGAQLTIGLG